MVLTVLKNHADVIILKIESPLFLLLGGQWLLMTITVQGPLKFFFYYDKADFQN